jgi:hypothetical protein
MVNIAALLTISIILVYAVMAVMSPIKKETIWGNAGPYLTRITLFSLGKKGIRLKLHQFHRSDEDAELHSHPWKWGIAFVLWGGYVEERWDGTKVVTKTVYPGMINIIRRDTFHRVDLRKSSAWTLFLVGPILDTWYFLDPKTGKRWYWKDFIKMKGLTPLEGIEDGQEEDGRDAGDLY